MSMVKTRKFTLRKLRDLNYVKIFTLCTSYKSRSTANTGETSVPFNVIVGDNLKLFREEILFLSIIFLSHLQNSSLQLSVKMSFTRPKFQSWRNTAPFPVGPKIHLNQDWKCLKALCITKGNRLNYFSVLHYG